MPAKKADNKTMLDSYGKGGSHYRRKSPRFTDGKAIAPQPKKKSNPADTPPSKPPPKKTKKGDNEDGGDLKPHSELHSAKLMHHTVKNLGDDHMQTFLTAWRDECLKSAHGELYIYALAGCVKGLLNLPVTSVYTDHHDNTIRPDDCRLSPPPPSRASKNGHVTYSEPGRVFQQAGRDCFNEMQGFLTNLVHYDLSPPRLYWDLLLIQDMMKVGPVTQHLRDMAMLVCLVLAAATMDTGCIVSGRILGH